MSRSSLSPMRRVGVVCCACVALALLAAPVLAHPADEIWERDFVHVRPDGVEIEMHLAAGVIKLYRVWGDADRDGDNRLTAAEREAYGAYLASGYAVTLDDATVATRYVPGSLVIAETREEFGRQGAAPDGATVRATFRVPFDGATPHALTINVNHYNVAAGGDTPDRPPELYADAEGIAVVAAGPDREHDLRLNTSPLPGAGAAPPFRSPATPAPVPPARSPNTEPVSRLTALLLAPAEGPGYALLGVGVAVLLGALHALTPGHGKTMVAAYLVGGRGRVRDAVLLGGVVTLTHTGSVILLGVGTLAFTRFVVPERVTVWLELLSALGILALGAALLVGRLRAMPRRGRRAGGGRQPALHAAPERSLALANAGTTNAGDADERDSWHSHDDGTEHSHGWFGSHAHTHAPPAETRLSPRALVLMGVSGGLVPCPDALAILLVAVAAGQLMLGLAVLLGFSLGLAAVLIALGVVIASTRVFERGPLRRVGGSRWARYVPPLSAATVVLVGGAMLLRAVAGILG